MDFDNYYEQYNGDEVIVHLDYLDPEPSLFQQTRGRGRRPSLNREYGPVLTSKQRLSRRRMTDALSYNEYHDNHHFQRDDYRDDDVYEQMTARVAIQDQRYESNRSMGRQNPNSRENSISDRNGSGRSVVSRSTASSKKNIITKKSKFDLTGPNADSSFEVLATLIVDHLETKVVNSQYVLDKSDMDFFDAIIPETLRTSFVEAVRFRSERLPSELEEDESNLQKITRKCAEFGLANSDENNFLLGGGLRTQDKIIMKMVKNNRTNVISSDCHDDDNHDYSVENSHVQEDDGEDIPASSFLGTNLGSTTRGDKVKKQLPRNQKTKKISLQEKYLEHDDLPILEDDQLPIDVPVEKQGPKTLMDRPDFEHFDEIRNDEITVEKRRKKKKGERASKKKIPSHAAIMSVYSSPSTLDANVAAFEHEWRDGLWDVFTHGVCHPLVFLSFCAPIFALGQVMTRLKLNWIGIPSNKDDGKSIFPKLGTIFSIWLSVNTLAICACTFAWIQMRSYIEAVSFLLVISNLWFFGFCVFVTGNTRRYIRDIYNIRESGNSDYLLAAIYMPFTIAQMGRHTADYNSLQGRICSPTGLVNDVDDSAIIENMNVYKSFNDDSETSSVSLA